MRRAANDSYYCCWVAQEIGTGNIFDGSSLRHIKSGSHELRDFSQLRRIIPRMACNSIHEAMWHEERFKFDVRDFRSRSSTRPKSKQNAMSAVYI